MTELAPPPRGARRATSGVIAPESPHFSGFVFKIQANMNKRHRDRVAFLRVCSGVFEKDMVITNAREGQEIRAARPYRFFGGKRETIDRAFPGDVVGLVNPGQFGIGDTLYADVPLKYPPIPRFPAEHFGIARLRDVRFKQFDEAIRQLEEEGLMQVLFPTVGRREPILGTVGPLQLEVLAVAAEGRIQRRSATSTRCRTPPRAGWSVPPTRSRRCRRQRRHAQRAPIARAAR